MPRASHGRRTRAHSISAATKVVYEKFDFKVLKTEHFDIYYYPEEETAVQLAGRMAERWYSRLQRLLRHDLSPRQPIILYAAHPHFEQTNVLPGELGEGTGGVTESIKRIIMPFAGPPIDRPEQRLALAVQSDTWILIDDVAVASITAADLHTRIEEGRAPAILDVRSEGEFAAGHVPGAVNIPFQRVDSRVADVPARPDDLLVVYCGHGPRAWMAARALRAHGFSDVIYLKGHWSAWKKLISSSREP